MNANSEIRSTTVLAVLRDGRLAMASDGQVTVGNTVVKQGAQKVRRAAKHPVLVGFAGGAADALALTERLEAKLEAQRGNVGRAAVELAKDWRTDRALRRLEAMLLVGDTERVLMVSNASIPAVKSDRPLLEAVSSNLSACGYEAKASEPCPAQYLPGL